MQRSSEYKAPSRMGRALAFAFGLLCAGVLSQPELAYAGPHGGGGGGGFHGGGFHQMGALHGGGFGGFHGDGFHGGGFHGDRFHDGRFRDGRFHNNGFFFGGSLAYPWWGYYPDYGYYDYGYSQPYSSATWYYCSDPAGYYPYVPQCNTGWQAVPAS